MNFPNSDERGKHLGWKVDVRELEKLRKEMIINDHEYSEIDRETLENVILCLEKLGYIKVD